MTFKVQIDEAANAADVEAGHFRARVDLGQFGGGLDDAARRDLFKHTVKRINLEISSYCNRRCGFCPNRDGTRLRDKTFLSVETFERVVRDLESVGYDKPVYFHLYNEPLADAEVLLERMAFARPRLPKSIFSITTNGDYLTRDLFDELVRAGLNRLYVSIYGPGQGEWDDAYIKDRTISVAQMLGLEGALRETPGDAYIVHGMLADVDVTVAGRNLWTTGYDRGGLVPELAIKRSSPCLSPITDVNVDFRGYVLPCCNVYTDRAEHLQYTFGNVNETDIFTAYTSAVAQQWKLDLLKFNPGGSLCSECSRAEYPLLNTLENRVALDALRARLGAESEGI